MSATDRRRDEFATTRRWGTLAVIHDIDRPCSPVRRRILAAAAGLVLAPRARVLGASQPFVLGVHPFLTRADLLGRFRPLALHLQGVVGAPVLVRIGGSYAEHERAIGTDALDLAFLGPVSYVRMLEQFGPKPFLARFEVDHQPYLHGVIAVRRDSNVRALADLRGRRVAFGDPDSTMGCVVPAWTMTQAGVPLHALGGYRFVGSHPNVALGVLAGDFDAGGLKREVYDEFAPRGLRILAETPPTPDHLFVARADLPAPLVESLRATLLSLHQSDAGSRVLAALTPGLTRLIPGSASDYEGLKSMLHAIGGEELRGQ